MAKYKVTFSVETKYVESSGLLLEAASVEEAEKKGLNFVSGNSEKMEWVRTAKLKRPRYKVTAIEPVAEEVAQSIAEQNTSAESDESVE